MAQYAVTMIITLITTADRCNQNYWFLIIFWKSGEHVLYNCWMFLVHIVTLMKHQFFTNAQNLNKICTFCVELHVSVSTANTFFFLTTLSYIFPQFAMKKCFCRLPNFQWEHFLLGNYILLYCPDSTEVRRFNR